MSKRKSPTTEECVKAFEKAFEGVNFDEQPRGESTLAPVPEAHKQQEPVAWGNFKKDGTLVGLSQHPEDQANWTGRKPLYTSPQPSKPWVGLTDEDWPLSPVCWTEDYKAGVAWAAAKLKEKNAP